MNRYLFALLSLGIVSCASTSERTPASTVAAKNTLTVIATTDFHGALEPEEVRLASGQSITIGGPGVLSAYMKIIKSKAPGPVLYLDAGDLFQGTMASNMFEGAPVTRLFNYFAPAAAALGNHEFDYGPVGPKSVPRNSSDDGQGALKKLIQNSKFPILAINLRDESGKMPAWIKGSIVKEIDGVRVGVIGAADEATPSTTNRMNLKGLRFLNPLEPVRAEAERLRKEEGVSAVVLVIHTGGGCDDNRLDRQDDLSSCKIADVFPLVEELPEGLVDVVVAGHTHRGVAKRINRTVILQTFSQGRYVGWATVPLGNTGKKPEVAGLVPVCTEVVNTKNGKTCDSYQLRDSRGPVEPATFLGEKIVPDTKADEIVRPELEQVRKLKEVSVGSEAIDDFIRNYSEENSLGNLLADVARESVPGVDLGLVNAGGIRANLNRGPLNYGHVFNVFPFDNQLAVMTVNGATLKKMAALGIDGGRGVFLWSSNLRIETEGCSVANLSIDGKPVSPTKLYKVATSDYLAGGGSGVSRLNIPESQIQIYWDPEFLIRDITANVLKRWKKQLRSKDFFDPANPRLVRDGECRTEK